MLLDRLLGCFADEPDQLLGPAQQTRDIGRLDGEKRKPARTQGRDSLALEAGLRKGGFLECLKNHMMARSAQAERGDTRPTRAFGPIAQPVSRPTRRRDSRLIVTRFAF